jgi:hypothetical protein
LGIAREGWFVMMLDKVERVLSGYGAVSGISRTDGVFADRLDFDFTVGDRVVRMGVDEYADDGGVVILVFRGGGYSQREVPRDAEAWEIGERVATVAYYA